MKILQNTKKSSLYSQGLLIFIHRTLVVERHLMTREISSAVGWSDIFVNIDLEVVGSNPSVYDFFFYFFFQVTVFFEDIANQNFQDNIAFTLSDK